MFSLCQLFIALARFSIVQLNWVMFSWHIVSIRKGPPQKTSKIVNTNSIICRQFREGQRQETSNLAKSCQKSRGTKKGGFENGWFWQMYPRSGLLVPGNIQKYPRSLCGTGGISECTPVLVFGTGEHPPKPPLWKPPFCKPPKKQRSTSFGNARTAQKSFRNPCPSLSLKPGSLVKKGHVSKTQNWIY